MTDNGPWVTDKRPSQTWQVNADQQRFFDKLPALAERLNVSPLVADDRINRYMVCVGRGDDKKCYDVFDLINATLDRVDEAISEMKKATEMKKAIGTK